MSRFLAALFALVLFPLPALACGGRDDPCALPSGNYHMAVPEVAAPRGIVMHLHGGGGRGRGLLNSGLAREALARGYVFVAPDGDQPTRRFKQDWSVRGKNLDYDRQDFGFLPEVMADVRARTGLEGGTVLLAGFSRGGSFVWDMACQMPDFADAYAPLAGAFWDDLPTECAAPVRLFHTHGWNDRTVPLEGRSFADGAVVQGDVWASLKILRETNGCDARQPERNSFEGDLWFRHWTDCAAGDIRLMLHKGGHGAPQGWATRVMDWFEGKGLDAEG
ncbi:polyhydroxybutyrate depolymerase [uncultured Tateyamaria sp.]|uniref:alpha/beta hydrolase family esterase n=1 Tax=uncultured Tateyamaria sp. TaxID=455651 RepID=UPI002605C968|nr:polyhydroxybutyrate depolymerase [uncultured Tateyamaria sp.]